MNLVSERLNVDDYEEAIELFYKRQWTDGLPVVLPTPRRVEALIEHERAGAKVRRLVKPSGTAPSPRELIEEASADSDAAVVGIGL